LAEDKPLHSKRSVIPSQTFNDLKSPFQCK